MKIKPVLAALTALAIALPASAQDFPITRIESRGLGTANIYMGGFTLVVPDTDTTRLAYGEGSRLRRYEVHLAKMFEITIWHCKRIPDPSQSFAFWEYYAANGDVKMGGFDISCPLALSVANAYGLGRTERTVITELSTRTANRTIAIDVPILQITGGKIDRWLTFVEGLKPRL
jgi:serine/threonine-protein kinase